MSKLNHLVLTPYDVILVDGKPAVILAPSYYKGKFDPNLLECAWVREDGTTGEHFEVTRDSDVFRVRYEQRKVQFLDGAKATLHVTFPEDAKAQIASYVKEEERIHDEDLHGVEENHPSFGTIRLSKISGHAKLFMSPFRHQHFIGITISRAKRYRSLSNDRLHGDVRQVIEVFLSEAQFAKFITSAYDGGGTPCTIHSITGTYMPEPPEGDEVEKFHQDVEKDAEKAASFLGKALEKAKALLDKPTVSKKDRQEVIDLIHSAERKLSDSMPFVISQLRERMEKVVADAATEVDAYVNRMVQNLGLRQLAKENPPIRMLTGSQPPDSPLFCEHANGVPATCPCPEDCYCRQPGRTCHQRK